MVGGPSCQIDVKLAKIEGRKNATIKDRDGSTYKAPVFTVSFPLYLILFWHENYGKFRTKKM